MIGSLLTTIVILLLFDLAAGQRPIIRGYTMLLGNCAEMYLNEKPINIDVQSCANECQRYTGCRGFSFDGISQNCWLKWGLCDRIKPTRLTPVVFYKNELWGFTAESGSCPGQLAVPAIFTDVVSCASECRAMANCSGFTYDFEGNVCYLKAQACPKTVPTALLAVESWVKYYRKDFWVPAALEQRQKFLEIRQRSSLTAPGNDLLKLEQPMANPLEMVFFDNNNAPYSPTSQSLSDRGDPWEAYANPSEGSDYVAVSEDTAKILVHRLTINNATEAACSHACNVDEHCSYFYLLQTLVTVRSNKSVLQPTVPSSTGRRQHQFQHSHQKWTKVIQMKCILFSKWNSSASSVLPERRRPNEGKLFEKVAHVPRGNARLHSAGGSNSQTASLNSHVTLLSLKKRKRDLRGHEETAPASFQLTQLPNSSSPTTARNMQSSLIAVFVLLSVDFSHFFSSYG